MTTKKKSPGLKAKELKEKIIKDKLRKLNPSLYNRTTGGRKRLQDRLKPSSARPPSRTRKKPSKAVPGGPFKPENKKNPVPGGPFKPGSGPKFSKPMKKFNLGGEASTSLGRATVRKSQLEAQRKRVDEMLERLYGRKTAPIRPKPKKKPKNPNRIKPKTKPKKP
jgi:hypothetical protein